MEAGKMMAQAATRRMRLRDHHQHQQRKRATGVAAAVGAGANGTGMTLRKLHRLHQTPQKQQQQPHSKQLMNNNHCNHHQHHQQRGVNNASVLFQHFNGASSKHYHFTREVHEAILGRLGHRPRQIPGHSLRALFNDMKLAVSDAQVDKMIQCARQSKHVGRKLANAQYLTFGEVCLFARTVKDMQKARHKDSQHSNGHKQKPAAPIEGTMLSQLITTESIAPPPAVASETFEVFLGGSCNPTTWRTDTAIPELQKHGITYYNPQVSTWAPELVALEHNAKQSACLLLYVVDSQTRSVVGMLEVAHLVASGRCVVLVAYPYREGQSIMDEAITQSEYTDLMSGQTSLLALVKSQGIKVHTSLQPALACTAGILRQGNANGLSADEQVTQKLKKLRETFDAYDVHRVGELDVCTVAAAFERLTRTTLDVHALYDYLDANVADAARLRISFDQFCVLIAEFGADASSPTPANGSRLFRITNNLVHYFGFLKTPVGIVHHDSNKHHNQHHIADVFLGGSRTGGGDWRTHIATTFCAANITYCNPLEMTSTSSSSTSSSAEHIILQWKRSMDASRVLLFYITADSRSLTSMCLAAHYIGLGKDVVLCIEHLPEEGVTVAGEALTKQAIKDYNRGRVYLADMARRKQTPVFESITEAAQAAIDLCR